MDIIKDRYDKKFKDKLEFRLISQGVSKRSAEEEWEEWFDYLTFKHGWRFDQKSNTWKSPEESLAEPQNVPTSIIGFELLPDFSMRLPSREVVYLRYDYLYGANNPMKYILDWLERIISGLPARIFLDVESKYQEFISYPKDRENLRLVINFYSRSNDESKEMQLDVLVPKKIVIEQFYNYIINVFCTIDRPDEFQVDRNEYQSLLVENFLCK